MVLEIFIRHNQLAASNVINDMVIIIRHVIVFSANCWDNNSRIGINFFLKRHVTHPSRSIRDLFGMALATASACR